MLLWEEILPKLYDFALDSIDTQIMTTNTYSQVDQQRVMKIAFTSGSLNRGSKEILLLDIFQNKHLADFKIIGIVDRTWCKPAERGWV